MLEDVGDDSQVPSLLVNYCLEASAEGLGVAAQGSQVV